MLFRGDLERGGKGEGGRPRAAPGGARQLAVAMATGWRGAGATPKRGQRSASLRLPAPRGSAGFASAAPVVGPGMGSCGPNPSACAQGSGPRAAAPH